MKLPKLLAAVVLSVSLYSCGCEDTDLGKLEFTNELVAFLPVQPAQGKSYYISTDGADQKLTYVNAEGTSTVQIPVRKTNYSGKFDPNSCKEYYTADQKVYASQVVGENLVSFTVIYRKEADPSRFNSNITNKDEVGDVIEFVSEYNNKFPTPIPSGSSSISSYKTMRSFLFNDASTSTIDNITYKQEFLPTITLNGVQHTNVYHIYLSQANQYRPEEQYIAEQYPALDYIKGIYVKEGTGIIHAYSFKERQIAISIK